MKVKIPGFIGFCPTGSMSIPETTNVSFVESTWICSGSGNLGQELQ